MWDEFDSAGNCFKEAFDVSNNAERTRNMCRSALAECLEKGGFDFKELWHKGTWKDHLKAPRMTARGFASLFGKPYTMLVVAVGLAWKESTRFPPNISDDERVEVMAMANAFVRRGYCKEGPRGRVFGLPEAWSDELLAKMLDWAHTHWDVDVKYLRNGSAKTSKPKRAVKKIDAGIEVAINGLLDTVGLPEISELSGTLSEVDELRDSNNAKDEALEDLKKQLAVASSASKLAPTKVVATGDVPSGEIEIVKAYDLFEVDASDRSMFDFDLPHGVWGGEHPYVPAKDDGYVFDPETLIPVLLAIANNRIPWLRGHTGTGKTTLVEQVYARLNLPLFRLNLDSDITRGELVGREVIRTDEDGNTVTEFVDGIIPMSMQQSCGLLLDEVDASRPDLGFVLQRLTEGKGFMLLEDGGRTVVPDQYFRMFATANTNGRGDETGLYSGTRALGTAFVNRFKPYIEVDYMTQEEEKTLLSEKNPTLDSGECDSIARYASEHRTAFKQGDVTLACSPRDTLAFAASAVDYKQCFGSGSGWLMLAFKHSILNAADSDDRQVLDGLANRVFKGE